MSLNRYITSDYISAANKLQGKKARRRIVAYVESYDDVLFWRMVLSQFENEKRYFEVMLPTHDTLNKGKKQALLALMRQGAGKDMIACVDADYDYLIQGDSPQSEFMLGNPYVIHTYVYAIENYQCYAPSLHNVCVMATLNDHVTFDFTQFLTEYSRALFPLFIWSIMLYRRGDYHKFTIYLYMQGHHLFDNVVAPTMQSVCDELRREREREIKAKALHSLQMQNELSAYTKAQSDISSMLKKNQGYTQSAPYQRMIADIDKILKRDEK